MQKYNKTIVALVTGIIGWLTVVVSSPEASITASEWVTLAVAFATGLGVYQIPNIEE